MSRRAGVVEGDETGLMPCLFVGMTRPGSLKSALAEARAHDDPLGFFSFDQEKPGRFAFEHQFGGTACESVVLSGAVLPLIQCNDSRAREALGALANLYFDGPFRSWSPDLDELRELRVKMLDIGPLDITTDFRELGEAFLTFTLTDTAYAWLAERFQMVTEISDSPDFARTSIEETSGMLPDLSAFLAWMSGPGRSCAPGWVRGAFLYANSD